MNREDNLSPAKLNDKAFQHLISSLSITKLVWISVHLQDGSEAEISKAQALDLEEL